MDLQHGLLGAAVLNRQNLNIYKDKLVDARGLSNDWNKMQRWARRDDSVNSVTNRTEKMLSKKLIQKFCWAGDSNYELWILVDSGVFRALL